MRISVYLSICCYAFLALYSTAIPLVNVQEELSAETLSVAQVASVKTMIQSVFPTRGNPQVIGDVLAGCVQLAFHDAGTWDKDLRNGGPDGCIDFSLADNKGISPATPGSITNLLSPVYERAKAATGISKADFYVLAGTTAIERAAGTRSISLPFKYGRVDGTDCTKVDAHRLPEGKKSTEHVVEVFATRMGLSLQDITALMGAHTIGRAQDSNSGYEGPWDRTMSTFDNAYFDEMVNRPWVRQTRVVDGTTHHNWIIPGAGGGTPTQMLNTDMCLAFEIGDSDEAVNNDDCEVFPGGRPAPRGRNGCGAQNVGTRTFVDRYISSEQAWLDDFGTAWTKMTELGWEGKLSVPGEAAPATPVAPVNPTPVNPTPVNPTPVNPTPVTPVTPSPVAPVTPDTPAPRRRGRRPRRDE